ncbi:MAG: hypothetical protein JXO72_08140 [Vicinamibacteria bacterium]|nr:hypothetical protein [Vicinamibacteria bacterium]
MATTLSTKGRLSSTQLLARVLDTPDLTEKLQALEPVVLARLIDSVGLEDAVDLVALATTRQLAQVFDVDLWKNDRPGQEERFDDDRFVVWLEAMLEAGDAFVASKLAELPEDLVTLAFQRRVLVVPLKTLMAVLEDEEQAYGAEKALASRLSEEIDDYELIARRHAGWDSMLAALIALDREHHDVVTRLLARCAAMSTEYIEGNGGLYAVLTAEEMLASDVAAEREDRRAEVGYVAPQSAAAFLKLARGVGETPATEHDPLTHAYFRDLSQSEKPVPRRAPASRRGGSQTDLDRLLSKAGILEPAHAPLLPAATESADRALFVQALQRLRDEDPALFTQRSKELAYLANVLIAACTFEGRRVRPIEAVRVAIATCDIGLELCQAPTIDGNPLTSAVSAHPADGLFRLGWSKLAPCAVNDVPDLARIRFGRTMPIP